MDRRRSVAVRLVPVDRHRPSSTCRRSTSPSPRTSSCPHTWDIAAEFLALDAVGATTAERLASAALFTLRNAAIGFVLGSTLGLALAIALVHVRVLERAVVPIIVASQTIPIIAIAPLIVIGLKADWFGVAIVLDVPDVLSRDHRRAAWPARLRPARDGADALLCRVARRDPAQAPTAGGPRPYLFTGFRIAAPAAVVGSIVGELPSLIQDGLARQIITGMQYYSLNAEYLWAAIVMSADARDRRLPARRRRRRPS